MCCVRVVSVYYKYWHETPTFVYLPFFCRCKLKIFDTKLSKNIINNIMQPVKTILLASLCLLGSCATTKKAADKACTKSSDYHVCAYIWPSCHNDSLARELIWPAGQGEWEVINQGDPRFPGHYQPREPLWKGDMDDDPQVVEKWIKTALKYGVDTFVYDWYWFYNYPFLEEALDNGFLKAPSNEKMNFYIMYANHEVTNYWNPHINKDTKSLTFDPRIDWEQWKVIVDRIIRQYFTRPNYVKINGCPVFSLWDFDLFTESFGSMEEAGKAMDHFREKVKEAGFPDLHLQRCGGLWKRGVAETARIKAQIERFGVESVAGYNMGGFDPDYIVHGMNALELRQYWADEFKIPVFPTVSISWDDTPRYPLKGEQHVTHYNHSPETFATFLQDAKEWADDHAGTQPKFIYVNAWNEYVESSYLLPDRKYGFGFLEAVRDVLDGKYDDPE